MVISVLCFLPPRTNVDNLSIVIAAMLAGKVYQQKEHPSLFTICFPKVSAFFSSQRQFPAQSCLLLSKLGVRSKRGFWYFLLMYWSWVFWSDIECLILMPNLQIFIMQVISGLSFSEVYRKQLFFI